MIGQCSSLAVLDLAWNDIGFRGTRSLARVLGRCHSLAELYLDRNRIGAEGARSLALEVAGAELLTRLANTRRQ